MRSNSWPISLTVRCEAMSGNLPAQISASGAVSRARWLAAFSAEIDKMHGQLISVGATATDVLVLK